MATKLPTYRNTGEVWDLELSQGATFGPVRHTLTNPDGSPVDLTGCVARGQVRRTALATEVLAEFVIGYAPDRTEGWYTFGLTDEQTAALTAGEKLTDAASTYAYDVELEDALGQVWRLLRGTLRVQAEVTREATP